MHPSELHVEASGTMNTGPCPCCGSITRLDWGFLILEDRPAGAYLVQWTSDRPDHEAQFDVVFGPFDSTFSTQDRAVASMKYRSIPEGNQLIAIDANIQPSTLLATMGTIPLRRDQIVNTALAKALVAVLKEVCLQDERLEEFNIPSSVI